ncbi:MAG: penicillin-insensitive murein endopeptidase [Myxococcota bacterium]
MRRPRIPRACPRRERRPGLPVLSPVTLWAPFRALFWGLLLGATSGCWSAPTVLSPRTHGSVGLPHHGVITDAAPLSPDDDTLVRFRNEGIHWGRPRLVATITAAAARVAAKRPGGAPLVVADLSARRGGRIPRHRSHRSGRDADLLFFVLTPDGRSIRNPGFLHFGRDGLAPVSRSRRTFVRLDVDRTWQLVKALVEDRDASLQWLFVARWLRQMLLDHAYARGEPVETMYRASKLLHQPSDSFAHDDHIHVRLACTDHDAVGGCRGGPQWPWLTAAAVDPAPSPLDDVALLRALVRPDPEG